MAAYTDAELGIGPGGKVSSTAGLDVPRSSFGAGLGSGIAGWKGGMGSVGGAVARAFGATTPDLDAWVQQKADEAAFYQRNSPGATTFFGDKGVAGDGKLLDWLAYNLGQSAPYVLEMLAGGVGGAAARGAAGGAVRAFGADAVAETAARNMGTQALTAAAERKLLEDAAAQVGTRWAAGTGAGLASYPSAVGDILMNQREAGGEDLGMAALGGVPYAAMNLLGGEGALLKAATGGLGRGPALLKAMGKEGLRAGAIEGLSETGQEVINQTFGRMAVNPEEGIMSGDAPMRYAESFMAGLGLGGPMGAVAPVFAKPPAGTPEEIAQRTDLLKNSLDYITRGIGTDLEVLEAGKANEKAFLAKQAKRLETERADRDKAQENERKDRELALKEAKQAEATAKEWADFDAIPVETNLLDMAERVLGRSLAPEESSPFPPLGKQRFAPAQPTIQDQIALAETELKTALTALSDAVAPAETPADPAQVKALKKAAAEAKRHLDELQKQAKPVGVDAAEFIRERLNRPTFSLEPQTGEQVASDLGVPPTYEQVVAAARARGETLSTSEELYNALINGFNSRQTMRRDAAQAGPTALETLTTDMLARQAAEKEAEAKAAEPRLNKPKEVPLRSAMEEALIGALKPLQEDAAWQKFIAEKEAQKQAEIDAAFAANPAAAGRDAKLIQGDMFGFKNQAVAKPGTTAEPAPNLADVNQWMSEGLQISADWAKASAAGDKAAMARLEKQAEAVYERAALGFPKAGGTAEMFQLREGEGKPRVTPAARTASGNWFKNPPTKEKKDGAQAPQAKQAEPAAPAKPEPAAEAAAGSIDTALAELANRFNNRVTTTPEEALRVIEAEAKEMAERAEAEKAAAAAPKPDLNALLKAKVERMAAEPAPATAAPPEPKTRRKATTVQDLKDKAAQAAERKAEAEEEAKADAREAKAEAEVEAGPLGEAMRKLEDGADFEGSNGNLSKAKIKAFAKKLEKAGLIDDAELNDDGRDTDASELMDELGGLVEDAISEAVAERVTELEAEEQESQAVPTSAPATETTTLLPELDAPWNVRKENRTRIEQLAAKGDEAKIAREWNEQYGDKFQYPELSRDLQLLVKHAIESVEVNKTTKRTQNKMSLDLADRVEQEQANRNAAEAAPTTKENEDGMQRQGQAPTEEVAPAPEPAPPVDPVAAAMEGIPKSLFSKVQVRYDPENGGEVRDMKASAAMKLIKQQIDDYEAFIKCLGS